MTMSDTVPAIIPCKECWAAPFEEEANRHVIATSCGVGLAWTPGHTGAVVIKLTRRDFDAGNHRPWFHYVSVDYDTETGRPLNDDGTGWEGVDE